MKKLPSLSYRVKTFVSSSICVLFGLIFCAYLGACSCGDPALNEALPVEQLQQTIQGTWESKVLSAAAPPNHIRYYRWIFSQSGDLKAKHDQEELYPGKFTLEPGSIKFNWSSPDNVYQRTQHFSLAFVDLPTSDGSKKEKYLIPGAFLKKGTGLYERTLTMKSYVKRRPKPWELWYESHFRLQFGGPLVKGTSCQVKGTLTFRFSQSLSAKGASQTWSFSLPCSIKQDPKRKELYSMTIGKEAQALKTLFNQKYKGDGYYLADHYLNIPSVLYFSSKESKSLFHLERQGGAPHSIRKFVSQP